MLFHIKQSHAPADCPYEQGGSKSLFDEKTSGIDLVGYWLDFPGHTTFLVVEADTVASVQKFLAPGHKVCTSEIRPVSSVPAAG